MAVVPQQIQETSYAYTEETRNRITY